MLKNMVDFDGCSFIYIHIYIYIYLYTYMCFPFHNDTVSNNGGLAHGVGGRPDAVCDPPRGGTGWEVFRQVWSPFARQQQNINT